MDVQHMQVEITQGINLTHGFISETHGHERPFTHSSCIVLPGGAAIKAVKENDLQAVA